MERAIKGYLEIRKLGKKGNWGIRIKGVKGYWILSSRGRFDNWKIRRKGN